MRGDPSDNIPGVAGIGEKTAADLIQKYGRLDQVYKEIKGNKFSLSKFELVYINSENKKIERIEGEKIKEI